MLRKWKEKNRFASGNRGVNIQNTTIKQFSCVEFTAIVLNMW